MAEIQDKRNNSITSGNKAVKTAHASGTRVKSRRRRMLRRAALILVVFSLVWAILLGRLAYLQIYKYDEYSRKVASNVQRELTVSATRGAIYDRNMTQLAANVTVWRVFISPYYFTDDEQKLLICEGLSKILGVDYGSILEKADKSHRKDETIKKEASEEEAEKVREFINENNLTRQVNLERSYRRYYPYGTMASQVIGVCGTDGGLGGLELYYNTELTGTAGRYITARSAQGVRIPSDYTTYVEAENGYNLITTIDVKIQDVLEKQLKSAYEESKPNNRVSGIIMDVNTGAVLAMGTYPNYDLNDPFTLDPDSQKKLDETGLDPSSDEYKELYWNLLYSLWKNKNVSEVYEPGSTMKVITTAMALQEKIIDIEEKFTCNGYYYVKGYDEPIACHYKYGHGTMPFTYMLQQSCNPTMMQIALRMGKAKFYNYFEAFGYTEKTGIDLPGEANTIYHSYNGFNQVELAVYSFGQTFKVSPITHLTAICAVANGGNLVTPHLIDKLMDDDGNVVREFGTQVKRSVVSSEVCKTISQILEEGVSGNGGAKNTYVAGYKIAAKTGTSQIRDVLDAKGDSIYYVGSTTAYAPSDDPKVAVLLIVDEPTQSTIYGSYIAAPYVAKIMEGVLPLLGIERSYSERELAKLSVKVANYKSWPLRDALRSCRNLGIDYEVVGGVAGDSTLVVNNQIPAAGSYLRKDTGKIVFYVGNAVMDTYMTVPSVIGLTSASANSVVTNAGFNFAIDGTQNYDIGDSAVVVAQQPPAGEEALYGSLVVVKMRYLDDNIN
ncbi:MAG: PASTA domain-containing protein [Clostridiales bacterium]|nr:PASTA domain-containing protein [Clostridiales bacterium]